MILDDIVVKRKEQLQNEKERTPFEEIKKAALEMTTATRDFKSAVSGERLAVISEVKKASPSKGIIKEDFHPVMIAKEYEQSGADAISVLTEEFYFKGSSDYLKQIREQVNIPLIRKDFIVDEYQIYEARAMGADAILLIVAILDLDTIIQFYKLAKSLGLDCLTEVHDEQELAVAIKANVDIIGINNRNLKTFEVDLETTKRLSRLIPDGGIIVSESGIATNKDMKDAKSFGANAVLIGETLMRSGSVPDSLASLRKDV
ncbi:MAG: Indole-3-glycerol phosphate synthase [Oscillospiraceae bacterium]|nr:Indole-3-glycerol phosphate synthase [Oscillospiraceae bacterium]